MSIFNVSESIVTKLLQDSTSVMYNRQASYYFLMKLNNWSRTDLHKAIKNKAESLKLPYNKGVTQKESAVVQYIFDNKNILFKDIEISKTGYNKIIKEIALIMQKNNLSYTYLKKYIVKNPKDSTTQGKQAGNDKTEESTDSTTQGKQAGNDKINLQAVIDFIKNCKKSDLLQIESAVMNKKASKPVKASKAA